MFTFNLFRLKTSGTLQLTLAFVLIYKMDTVTSMKALNKTVEASQLTSDLGGTFTYSHSDWLQFHQVINTLTVFTEAQQL